MTEKMITLGKNDTLHSRRQVLSYVTNEDVVKKIASREQKPLRVVFRDSSFTNSPAKINVEEIFKLLSPNTKIKVL